MTFLVDANTVSAEDTAGGKHLNLSMYATVYSPGGKMLTTGSQKVDQSFDASTYQRILQQGLMLHMDLDPQSGSNNQIRLAVQDGRTGLVGTIDAPAHSVASTRVFAGCSGACRDVSLFPAQKFGFRAGTQVVATRSIGSGSYSAGLARSSQSEECSYLSSALRSQLPRFAPAS